MPTWCFRNSDVQHSVLLFVFSRSNPWLPFRHSIQVRQLQHYFLFACFPATTPFLTIFRWVHKLDIPAFPWPVAPFPALKYPLKDFEAENAAEEKRCLDAVELIFSSRQHNSDAVAGCIVEPILAEGGDKSASHEFFRSLRSLCTKCVKQPF